MFDNIGGKIKNLAQVLCWIGIIASVVGAIALWAQNSRYYNTIALGFGVLIGGAVGSWVGSFFMYGFGELIEETTLNRQINERILDAMEKTHKEQPETKEKRNVPTVYNWAERKTSNLSSTNSNQNRWKCAKCGTMNEKDVIMCKDCGTYK